MNLDGRELVMRVMFLIPLVLSLTVHEWAHAWSAFKLGDDTASRQGRLTLNPIPHIDPLGTLILPLLGIPFGWAKPVPVNPTRFRRDVNMSTGMMITAAAGPISNVVLAIVCAVATGLVLRFAPDLLDSDSGLWPLLAGTIQLNVVLAIFNILPIPPLDGSRIVDGLLPYRFRPQWESVTRYSSFILLAVILLGRDLLDTPIVWMRNLIYGLIAAAAGG
jgi:Zn-dependent protease